MLLKLKEIKEAIGASVPFSYQLDLSSLSFFGEQPLKVPVSVHGQVRNKAGILLLEADVQFVVDTVCSRCLKPLHIQKQQSVQQVLADHLQDTENDEILLIEGDTIDVDAIISEAIVLEMDSVFLCSESCKGLCPKCGADLNMTKCSCEPDISDQRLAVLKDILENMSEK